MTDQPVNMLSIYQGWETYQQLLVAAVSPLSAEQLKVRIAPNLRSAVELTRHIIGVRVGWMHFVLGEGDEKFMAVGAWAEDDATPRSGAELADALVATWQVIKDALQRWTPADLDAVFQDTDDEGNEYPVTRGWVIWHLVEHDLHHGGELSFTLGMHHLAGIDI